MTNLRILYIYLWEIQYIIYFNCLFNKFTNCTTVFIIRMYSMIETELSYFCSDWGTFTLRIHHYCYHHYCSVYRELQYNRIHRGWHVVHDILTVQYIYSIQHAMNTGKRGTYNTKRRRDTTVQIQICEHGIRTRYKN